MNASNTQKNIISGNKIINFSLASSEEFNITENFEIDISESSFKFELKNTNVNEHLNNVASIFTELKPRKITNLYCLDPNNKPFTLYDCYISPENFPVKSVFIVWNSMIYGAHIEKELVEINNLNALIENDKKSYRLSIGKNNFKIKDDTITITTDWHRDNGIFNGIEIKIESEDKYPLENITSFLHRLLDMFYFFVGYCAEIKSLSFMLNQRRLAFYNPNGLMHRTKKNKVSLQKRLYPTDNNFSNPFDIWNKMFSQNIPLFNMFFSTQYIENFNDVNTSILIQCLEGYYREFREGNIKFSNEAKKAIINDLKHQIEESENINQICDTNKIDESGLISSAVGLLGRINEKSLWTIINESIDYNEDTKLIFEYEDKNDFLKNFKKKLYGHRNLLAHLGKRNISFNGNENALVQSKLELLFRVIVLSDIGIKIDRKSLVNYINKINMWYDENSLSPIIIDT